MAFACNAGHDLLPAGRGWVQLPISRHVGKRVPANLYSRIVQCGMNNTANSLREKTDLELIAMARELAVQIDRILQEQARRSALATRQSRAAEDAQENEGGLSPAKPS